MKFKPRPSRSSSPNQADVVAPLRIIGGDWRGRKLEYLGDLRTRPMKDRVREAVFNLLGPGIKGKHVLDVFAGTGAIGLEALSRGAAKATFLEQHFPTADTIRRNAAALGATDRINVVPGNAFIWGRRLPDDPAPPWVVFVSPPWDLFLERTSDMMTLVSNLIAAAPPESAIVVEADDRFDVANLPQPGDWDVRTYFPAVIALLRK